MNTPTTLDNLKIADYASTREIIDRGGLLSEKDYEFINTSIADIQRHWEIRQVFRTETEMRVSVLNDFKFPTPAAKYWQCVREQSVFYEQLVALSFDYRRNKIKIKKLEQQIAAADDPLEKELLQIDLEEATFGQLNMKKQADERVRELRLWDQLIAECREQDTTFDDSDVNSHQLVSYLNRWHNQLIGLRNSESSVSEVNNLLGQYATGLRRAYELGLILPEHIAVDAKEFGIPYHSLKSVRGSAK